MNQKYCSKCKLLLDITFFHKDKNQKSGYACDCKKCKKKYRDENKDKIKNKQKEYKIKNKEKYAEYSRKWRKRNPEKSKYVFEKWAKKYPEKVKNNNKNYAKKYPWKLTAKVNKRRGIKLNATPKWLSLEQLKEIELLYKESKHLTISTGTRHNVDHIIPLQGKNVCGLHVPWNLRIITENENLKKSNNLILEIV
jgi:hypothetical protein